MDVIQCLMLLVLKTKVSILAAVMGLFALNSCNLFLHSIINTYDRSVPLSRLPELEAQRWYVTTKSLYYVENYAGSRDMLTTSDQWPNSIMVPEGALLEVKALRESSDVQRVAAVVKSGYATGSLKSGDATYRNIRLYPVVNYDAETSDYSLDSSAIRPASSEEIAKVR